MDCVPVVWTQCSDNRKRARLPMITDTSGIKQQRLDPRTAYHTSCIIEQLVSDLEHLGIVASPRPLAIENQPASQPRPDPDEAAEHLPNHTISLVPLGGHQRSFGLHFSRVSSIQPLRINPLGREVVCSEGVVGRPEEALIHVMRSIARSLLSSTAGDTIWSTRMIRDSCGDAGTHLVLEEVPNKNRSPTVYHHIEENERQRKKLSELLAKREVTATSRAGTELMDMC